MTMHRHLQSIEAALPHAEGLLNWLRENKGFECEETNSELLLAYFRISQEALDAEQKELEVIDRRVQDHKQRMAK